MSNLIAKKNWYFAISLLVLIPGIYSLFRYGLKLSIDFTGGSIYEFEYQKLPEKSAALKVFDDQEVRVETVQASGNNRYIFKSHPVDNAKNEEIKKVMGEAFSGSKEITFETVGPTVGREATLNALYALGIASLGIVLYIAYSFRQVPKPYSSLRFGVSAILATLHDAFVLLGTFSLLGHYAGVEINALFITATLTVIGFSVHDTIVVFDRIRENLLKLRGLPFDQVVNFSLLETLNRSLRTSLTVVFTLLALLLLGGESIRWFVVALLVGIISGTYSSIFNAAPVLVVWEEFNNKRKLAKSGR